MISDIQADMTALEHAKVKLERRRKMWPRLRANLKACKADLHKLDRETKLSATELTAVRRNAKRIGGQSRSPAKVRASRRNAIKTAFGSKV